MRKGFLFYANWCRVEESLPEELESFQVIENSATVAVHLGIEAASLSGTSRALMRGSRLREWSPPTEREFDFDGIKISALRRSFAFLNTAFPPVLVKVSHTDARSR
jgi:hypothetical protein